MTTNVPPWTRRCASTRIRARLVPWVALLTLLGSAGAEEKILRFKFDPPAGTTFVETARLEKSTASGPGQPEKQVMEGKTEYVIRKSKGGYSVSTRPLKPANLHLSADAAASVNSMLSSLNLTYDLDPNGRLVRVRGADQAIEQLEQTTGFGKKEFGLLLRAMSGSDMTLEDYLAAFFRQRELFSLMSGATVEPGQPVTAKGRVAGPLGVAVDATVHRNVTGLVACGKRSCARVEFTVESEDERIGQALANGMRDALLQMARAVAPPDAGIEAQIPEVKAIGSSLATSTVRLIEPATGLPHLEQSTTTVKATLEIAGEPTPLVIVEKQDYRYAY